MSQIHLYEKMYSYESHGVYSFIFFHTFIACISIRFYSYFYL